MMVPRIETLIAKKLIGKRMTMTFSNDKTFELWSSFMPLKKEILYSMSNNPGNCKGTFYVNKKDPRILVPKANPATGWTLNFGKPISYVVVAVFVMIVIASVFLLK